MPSGYRSPGRCGTTGGGFLYLLSGGGETTSDSFLSRFPPGKCWRNVIVFGFRFLTAVVSSDFTRGRTVSFWDVTTRESVAGTGGGAAVRGVEWDVVG